MYNFSKESTSNLEVDSFEVAAVPTGSLSWVQRVLLLHSVRLPKTKALLPWMHASFLYIVWTDLFFLHFVGFGWTVHCEMSDKWFVLLLEMNRCQLRKLKLWCGLLLSSWDGKSSLLLHQKFDSRWRTPIMFWCFKPGASRWKLAI